MAEEKVIVDRPVVSRRLYYRTRNAICDAWSHYNSVSAFSFTYIKRYYDRLFRFFQIFTRWKRRASFRYSLPLRSVRTGSGQGYQFAGAMRSSFGSGSRDVVDQFAIVVQQLRFRSNCGWTIRRHESFNYGTLWHVSVECTSFLILDESLKFCVLGHTLTDVSNSTFGFQLIIQIRQCTSIYKPRVAVLFDLIRICTMTAR